MTLPPIIAMIPALLLLAAPAAWGAAIPSVDQSATGAISHPADAAVVVGNEDYGYLQDVPYAVRDAEAFRDWVVRGRGIPDARVRLLINASHASIREAIEAAAVEVQSGGILWIYFAGHGAGVVRPEGSTERSLVGKSAEADASTLNDFVLRLSEIETIVAGSQASQAVLILDACYANADRSGNPLLGGRFVVPDVALAPPPKVAVWTGTSSTEVAEGYDAAQHGLFTYFALSALQGQADGATGPKDGQITLDEAAAWTAEAVRMVGEHRQNPTLTTDASNRTVIVGTAPQGLVPMDLPALPKSKATSGVSALKADLERLRREQEAARATEERVAAELVAKTAAARQAFLSEASQAWTDVQALAFEPGDAAEFAVRRYLEVYEKSTITIDGIPQAIEVPEVAEAYVLLEELERLAKKRASTRERDLKKKERNATPTAQSATPIAQSAAPTEQSATPIAQSATPIEQSALPQQESATSREHSFPWLLTTGGVVGLAGGGILVWNGLQEQAFLADDPSNWTADTAAARQSALNTFYIVGYSALAAGVATGLFQFIDVTPGLGIKDGMPLWTLSGRW